MHSLLYKMLAFIVLIAATGTLNAQQVGRPAQANADSARGKAIFVSRCAQCHDKDGAKKLSDGTTLLGRLSQSKNAQSRLATRLKTQQESRDVMLYLATFLSK